MAFFEPPTASERIKQENLRLQKEAASRREMTEHSKARAAEKVDEAYRQNIGERVQNGYRVTDRDLENLKKDFKDADPADYATKLQERLLKEATVEKLNSSLYRLADKADEATKTDYQKFADEVGQARAQGTIGNECAEHYLKQSSVQENFYEALREKDLAGNSLERPGAYPEGRPEPPTIQTPDVCLDRASYMDNLVDPKDLPDPKAPEPAKPELPENLQRLNEAVKDSQERSAVPVATPQPESQEQHQERPDPMKPDGSAREAELLKEQVTLARADAIANNLMPDPAKEKTTEPAHEPSELSKAISEARAEHAPAERQAPVQLQLKLQSEHQEQHQPQPQPEPQVQHQEHPDPMKPDGSAREAELLKEQVTLARADAIANNLMPDPAKEKTTEPAHEPSELSKAISEARAEHAPVERSDDTGREEKPAEEHQEKSAAPVHDGQQHDATDHQAGARDDDMWEKTGKDDDDYGRDD